MTYDYKSPSSVLADGISAGTGGLQIRWNKEPNNIVPLYKLLR